MNYSIDEVLNKVITALPSQ